MEKNIVFILFLLTISCTYHKEKSKNLSSITNQECFCENLYAYDEIVCLKKQIEVNKKNDTSSFKLHCQLAEAYFKINDIEKLSNVIIIIDSVSSNISSNKLLSIYYKIKGLEQINYNKYKEAIETLKKSASLVNEDDTSLIFIYNKIGLCYEKLKMFDSSEYQFKKALYYKKFLKNIYTDDIEVLYNALAYISWSRYSDLYTSKLYYDTVELVLKRIHNPDSSLYAWNLYNIGLFYQVIGQASKAEEYYLEALKIYSKYPNLSSKMAIVANNQTTVYISLEKFEIAQSKIDWNIIYYTKNFNPEILVDLYFSRAYTYFRQRKNKKAIETYKYTLGLSNKYLLNYEDYILNSLAWCYSNENMLDSAEYYFKKSMANLKKKSIYDVSNMVTLYGEYSRLLIKQKKYQNALNIINSNLGFLSKKIGTRQTQYGYFIYWKALALEKLEKYDESLEIYQDIIDISINKKHKDHYLLSDFKISDIIEHDNLIDALIGKAGVLAKMAKNINNNREQIELFKKSLMHYEKAFEVVTTINKKIESENDRLIFTGKKAIINEKILLDAFELYKLTNKQEYLEKAFFVADMGKATQMVLGLKDDEYKHLSGIPEDLIKKEKDLQEEISLIQSSLRDENYKKHLDSAKTTELNNKLYNAINLHEKLTQKMSSDYPYYNHIKYSANNLKIDSLKSLIPDDKVLISYAIVGDSLFSFLLTGKHLKINTIYYKGLNDSITDFRKVLTEVNENSFTYDGIKEYVPRAYSLYKILLKPFEKEIEGKNLILIPDGLLNLLPFEALITSNNLPLKTDWAILPYLINKHAISYSYSAELFVLRNKMKTIPTNQVLAYAPEYNNTIIEVPSSSKEGNENIQLGQLKGSEEEASEIVFSFGGKAIEGKKATKSHFKDNAGKNCIIHLAMHTIIDNENPLYSKLVFTPYTDNHDKSFLNTYEIYNLKMQAPLVVLSACNTGYGKIMKGEGIISLARGFIFSGCPSLVITLWSIADRSSSNVMQSFYKNLKSNNDVDIALQNAKLEYIENADQRLSHPYFWAGYIQTGKTVTVYEKAIDYKKIIAISIIISILGFALIIRKYF
jgi:CHAT domain-containing protein/Tfp pilus assembly protein PilF